jgi:hypothetical protein
VTFAKSICHLKILTTYIESLQHIDELSILNQKPNCNTACLFGPSPGETLVVSTVEWQGRRNHEIMPLQSIACVELS